MKPPMLDGERSEALPEPRHVKRKMLAWREKAHVAASEYSNQPHDKNWRRWKSSLMQWYLNVFSFVEEMQDSHRDYSELENIREWVRQPDEDLTGPDLWRLTEKLEELMKELGVTDIGISRPMGEWGYDFLQGLPYSGEVERMDEGWRRLLENVRNMRKTLRIDTDLMGIIWGPNRVGKDTLAIQLTIPEGEEPQREQFVMNDDDFWTAVEQDQYFTFYMTEMSDHFYTQDTAKRSNKKKKRKLKKYAKENMMALGCDLNWWKIDQEVVADKVSFAIHIPRRGFFEFYTKAQVARFERGEDKTEVVTPQPAFTGRFPKLTRKDPRWRLYKNIEDEKLDVEREEVEEDAVNVEQIIQKVKERAQHFSKKYGDSRIVQKGVLMREFEELRKDDDALNMVKAGVENDMGWRE